MTSHPDQKWNAELGQWLLDQLAELGVDEDTALSAMLAAALRQVEQSMGPRRGAPFLSAWLQPTLARWYQTMGRPGALGPS